MLSYCFGICTFLVGVGVELLWDDCIAFGDLLIGWLFIEGEGGLALEIHVLALARWWSQIAASCYNFVARVVVIAKHSHWYSTWLGSIFPDPKFWWAYASLFSRSLYQILWNWYPGDKVDSAREGSRDQKRRAWGRGEEGYHVDRTGNGVIPPWGKRNAEVKWDMSDSPLLTVLGAAGAAGAGKMHLLPRCNIPMSQAILQYSRSCNILYGS